MALGVKEAKIIEETGLLEEEVVQRKRAEEALRNSKEFIETVFNSINDAISVIDTTNFRIVAVNTAFLNTLGMEEKDVIGKHCYEVTHHRSKPCEPPDETCPLAETLKTGKHSSAEHIHYDKDGREIYVEVSTSPIRNEKGEIPQVVHIACDITERKRAEEVLRQREQEFKALVENAPDAISRFDKEFRHIYVNPTVERESGMPPEAFIGKTNRELGTPENLVAKWREAIESVFETGQEKTIETKYPTPSGIRHYSNRLAPEFSEDGSVETVLNISRDITERKRAEEEIRRRRAYLATLQRINATLRSTLPLSQVLDTIVRATTEALGYVGSFITVPDPTGERLTLGAAWGGRIVHAALKVTRFKLESFSVPVKVQENLIARAFVSGELQAATGNPEAMAVGTEPSISGKMASAIERISGAKGTACVPLRVGEKSVGVLIIVSPREQLADEERAMLLSLADQAGLAIQNARLYEDLQTELKERKRAEKGLEYTLEKLRKALGATIQAMALTVEAKDAYTAGHQQRSTNLARTIATKMGLSEEQIDGIRLAGVIHDIGKISVPGEILSKPGRLTDIEFSLIKTHPQVGYDILKPIEFPWPVAQIVLQHHERIDGSGYPAGLTRDEIMLEARILAVADVVEAMCSHRPYRPAHSIDEALGEIRQNRGVRYDPDVVDACLSLFSDEGFELEHA